MDITKIFFTSANKTPNLKFIIGKFLSNIFYLHNTSYAKRNRQEKLFPKGMITKYFSRIRRLLMDKYVPLKIDVTKEIYLYVVQKHLLNFLINRISYTWDFTFHVTKDSYHNKLKTLLVTLLLAK